MPCAPDAHPLRSGPGALAGLATRTTRAATEIGSTVTTTDSPFGCSHRTVSRSWRARDMRYSLKGLAKMDHPRDPVQLRMFYKMNVVSSRLVVRCNVDGYVVWHLQQRTSEADRSVLRVGRVPGKPGHQVETH